jgi:chromosome segregation ATPase
MNGFARRLSWCGAAILSALYVTTALAQGRNDGTDGSLAALTSELRQLRVAVEELTRTQTQTQALGVYLSVQQSRILQVGNRLDAVRKDLDTASVRSQEIEAKLASFSDELPRATGLERRAFLEDATRNFTADQRRVGLELQQARSRESELSQALQLEESRWNDLISRLEQLIRK